MSGCDAESCTRSKVSRGNEETYMGEGREQIHEMAEEDTSLPLEYLVGRPNE